MNSEQTLIAPSPSKLPVRLSEKLFDLSGCFVLQRAKEMCPNKCFFNGGLNPPSTGALCVRVTAPPPVPLLMRARDRERERERERAVEAPRSAQLLDLWECFVNLT